MESKAIDRRIRKTRTMLRKCLGSLLKTKKIQDISVREISEMADINRGTFYLHYRDVYDLLDHVESDLVGEINGIIDRHKLSEVEEHPRILAEELFSFIKDNSDMIQILLGNNGDMDFINQLKNIVKEKILAPWAESMRRHGIKDFERFYSFSIGGFLGIVDYWFYKNLDTSPAALAEITEQYILGGQKSLEKNQTP